MDISRVKFNLNRTVIHNGAPYRFTACLLRLKENDFYYEAELQDSQAQNSTLYCPLSTVEEVK